MIADLPGSSAWFAGSVVCYSNETKHSLLGVNEDTLSEFGAVSGDTVLEMSDGLFAHTEADVAVSISGIAGPDGGTDEKPVGLVYIGLALKDKLIVKKFLFLKDRKANKLLSSLTAMNMLRLELLK